MGMAKYADITPFYEWLDWLEKESNTPYPEYETMMFYEIRDKLDTLQEVVRCKDCEYFTMHNDFRTGRHLGFGECHRLRGELFKDDDFCSYGERKDNV